MSVEGFIEEAARIVGDRWVLTEPWQLLPYSMDYWPLAVYRFLANPKAWREHSPSAAVLPGSEDEVVELLEATERHGVPLVPYAGGSGVLGGAVPERGWVVVDVSRLEWVEWYDEDAGIVDVGAGTPLVRVEEWLNSRGATLRHYPQSLPEAVIGGLIATRSTGQYSTGYGGIEDRVKGLNVAVPRLGLLRVKPAPRRSALTPLEQFFTGSEGLFGIITRAYLEALPLPECQVPVAWRSGSFLKGLDHARILVKRRLAPELLRVYDEVESALALGVEGATAIGVYEGDCSVVEARIEAAERLLGVRIREWSAPAERWLKERFNVVSSLKKLLAMGLAFDTIEVSATWGSVGRVYEALRSAAGIPGVVYVGVHASHFYPSGAALYMTFAYEASKLEEKYMKVWDTVMREVSKAGGSIAHHHGIGRHRLAYLRLEIGDEGVSLLKKLKECIDPSGTLRRGALAPR